MVTSSSLVLVSSSEDEEEEEEDDDEEDDDDVVSFDAFITVVDFPADDVASTVENTADSSAPAKIERNMVVKVMVKDGKFSFIVKRFFSFFTRRVKTLRAGQSNILPYGGTLFFFFFFLCCCSTGCVWNRIWDKRYPFLRKTRQSYKIHCPNMYVIACKLLMVLWHITVIIVELTASSVNSERFCLRVPLTLIIYFVSIINKAQIVDITAYDSSYNIF